MATKEKKTEEAAIDNAAEIKKENNAQIEQIKSFLTDKLGKLDSMVKDLSNDIKNKHVPAAESKIKDNLLTSLAVSFASGLCLGLVLLVLSVVGISKKR